MATHATLFESSSSSLHPRWTQTCIGNGILINTGSSVRMEFPGAESEHYTNAQIDDYAGLARSAFPWKPPLRMHVRARSSMSAATPESTSEQSDILRGTAGFGFWNYPFSVRGDILMLPESIWFFYASPPSNMTLVPHLPGWGWKAQIVHSMRIGALAAVLPATLSTTWGRLTGDIRPAAHWMQRLSGAHETLLPVKMEEWHTYTLEWRAAEATFSVDGTQVLRVPQPPTRPLGFVAWLDNQYAIATPHGILRFGTVASGPQYLELSSVDIELLT